MNLEQQGLERFVDFIDIENCGVQIKEFIAARKAVGAEHKNESYKCRQVSHRWTRAVAYNHIAL